MKTIELVTRLVEREETIDVEPKYAVGDLVEIYSGNHEGHCFSIKDVRYNRNMNRFEYLYDWPLYDEWHGEGFLTLHRRAA